MNLTCTGHPDWAPIAGGDELPSQQYALHVARPDHPPVPGVTPMTSQEWADYGARRGAALFDAAHPGWEFRVNAERLNAASYDADVVGQVYGLGRHDKAGWTKALADLGVPPCDAEYSYGLDAPSGVTFMDLNDSWRREIATRRFAGEVAARKAGQATSPLGRAA
jgi:hypothetical protein